MGEIISTFHLDWKIIIAQLVNFSIVVFVLWFFALKPLAKMMSQRTETIEKSLKDAEKIEERLKAIQKEREEQILTARKEAEVLISQAKDLAEKQKQDTVQKTGDEVAKTVALAKTQIASEKEKMLDEIKTEVVELITQTSGKKKQTEIEEFFMAKLILERKYKLCQEKRS